jgi:hypothetical protein
MGVEPVDSRLFAGLHVDRRHPLADHTTAASRALRLFVLVVLPQRLPDRKRLLAFFALEFVRRHWEISSAIEDVFAEKPTGKQHVPCRFLAL